MSETSAGAATVLPSAVAQMWRENADQGSGVVEKLFEADGEQPSDMGRKALDGMSQPKVANGAHQVAMWCSAERAAAAWENIQGG